MKEPELDQFMSPEVSEALQVVAAYDAIDFGYDDNPQIDKVLHTLNRTDPDLLREAFAKWFNSSACSPSLTEDVFDDLLESRLRKEDLFD